MNSFDAEDRLIKILKYGKYVIVVFVILVAFFVIRSCKSDYSDIEANMIEIAKQYIVTKNISVNDEIYLELANLSEVEGTELCSKASGVIVTNDAGTLKYKAYLQCPDYQSKIIDNKTKYITLNDSEIIILNKGEAFNDPMYVKNEEVEVEITGVVGSDIGIYTLKYDVYVGNKLKDTVIRKIIIAQNDKTQNISGIENAEVPTIILNGDKNIVLNVGEKYSEPGYTAIDYIDGKISRKVVVEGVPIDESKVGKYTILYKVSNSRGKSNVAVRIVEIVQKKATLDITISNSQNIGKNVDISLNIEGEGYKYTILPNGAKNALRSFTYSANENRIYEFAIYDIYNNKIIKEIEITNVDNIPPTGTCSAKVSDSKTEIEVIATDNKGVAEYSYIINGVSTPFKEESFYSNPSKSSTVAVDIKDISDNVSRISCKITIEDDNSLITDTPNDPGATLTQERFNNTNGRYLKYFLYVPSISKTEKVPLIVYLHGDGEKGDNLDITAKVSIPKYLNQGIDFKAVVIAPQMLSGYNWYSSKGKAQLKELIDYIVKNYNIDSKRIILTGHSGGAIGVWHMAATYKNFFSCVVPLSYGDTLERNATSLAADLTYLPVYAYVGENDSSKARMKQLVEAIKALGGDAEITVLDGKGHSIQDDVYLHTSIFNWMYRQQKKD